MGRLNNPTNMLMILCFVVLARGNQVFESACSALSIPHFYQNDHCFTYHDTPIDVSGAESTCAQGFTDPVLTGGRLAVLPNTTIMEAFVNTVGPTNFLKIGAYQDEPIDVVDANWYWKERPIQTSSVRIEAMASAGQAPWYSSQPGDDYGDERCVVIGTSDKRLWDTKCGSNHHFACEFLLKPPCNLTNPCENNGICVDDMTTLTSSCNCTPQWYGENCTEPVPPCNLTNPCENNGTCVDDMTTLTSSCNCTEFWTGDNCTILVPRCDEIPPVSLRPSGTAFTTNFENKGFSKQEGPILAEIAGITLSLVCTRECHDHSFCTSFTLYNNGTCTLHPYPKGHACFIETPDPNAKLFVMI